MNATSNSLQIIILCIFLFREVVSSRIVDWKYQIVIISVLAAAACNSRIFQWLLSRVLFYSQRAVHASDSLHKNSSELGIKLCCLRPHVPIISIEFCNLTIRSYTQLTKPCVQQGISLICIFSPLFISSLCLCFIAVQIVLYYSKLFWFCEIFPPSEVLRREKTM